MTEALSVADVLERAADLIEPEGKWTQGMYSRHGGSCFCVLGALAWIADVNPDDPWFSHIAAESREWLADAADVTSYNLVDWNDAPQRTQAEVVAKLREAAALARSQEQVS